MIMQSDTRIINIILYLILIIIGIFTIYYQLNFEDFWLDEMSSFWIADPTLTYSETIDRHKETDWHNPILFNILLKNFLKFAGYEPSYARYLSLFFGSLSLVMFGLISLQEKKNNNFILATFLACISIYIIKYSQELRPYSLLLFTSSINIFFYIKILNSSETNKANIILFIFSSVINYSVNPFALIIFFSQISYSIFQYFVFNKMIKKYLLGYLFIAFFYMIFNYNYILDQISFDNYMLSHDIKNVFDGFYFPRFFGSKIMGYFYLILLFFLILKNKNFFLKKNNNYMFFLILIIYCYLVPLVYGLIMTPVFHDRYIIFILIPILILISFLINESFNLKLKSFLIFFLVSITLANHYIEIFKRTNTKPEFRRALYEIKNSDTKDIILNLGGSSMLVSNYIKNLKINKSINFNYYSYDDFLPKNKSFWLLCYSPNNNFNCEANEFKDYKEIDTKKYLFVEAKLFAKN